MNVATTEDAVRTTVSIPRAVNRPCGSLLAGGAGLALFAGIRAADTTAAFDWVDAVSWTGAAALLGVGVLQFASRWADACEIRINSGQDGGLGHLEEHADLPLNEVPGKSPTPDEPAPLRQDTRGREWTLPLFGNITVLVDTTTIHHVFDGSPSGLDPTALGSALANHRPPLLLRDFRGRELAREARKVLAHGTDDDVNAFIAADGLKGILGHRHLIKTMGKDQLLGALAERGDAFRKPTAQVVRAFENYGFEI